MYCNINLEFDHKGYNYFVFRNTHEDTQDQQGSPTSSPSYCNKRTVKVRKSRNDFFKTRIPPKNERKNSFFWPNSTINEFFCSFFGGILVLKKSFRN